MPLAGLLLRRIGSEFVDRFNRHAGGMDARRSFKAADAGQALAFFPEGTFLAEPGLGKFHSGAFAIAARADLPVVPLVIRGTRHILPCGRFLPRPGRIDIQVLPSLGPLPDLKPARRDRADCAIKRGREFSPRWTSRTCRKRWRCSAAGAAAPESIRCIELPPPAATIAWSAPIDPL